MKTCEYTDSMENFSKGAGSLITDFRLAGKYSNKWPDKHACGNLSTKPKTMFTRLDYSDVEKIGDMLSDGLEMLEYFRDNSEVSVGIDEVKGTRNALIGVLYSIRLLSFVYDYTSPVTGDRGGRISEMPRFKEFKQRWNKFRSDMDCIAMTPNVKVDAKSDWFDPKATHIFVEISYPQSDMMATDRTRLPSVVAHSPRMATLSYPQDDPVTQDLSELSSAKYEAALVRFLERVEDEPLEAHVEEYVHLTGTGVSLNPDIIKKHGDRIKAAEGALSPYYMHFMGADRCMRRNGAEAEFRSVSHEVSSVLSAAV